MTTLTSTIITIIAFILALTFHEFSHALTAYLLGDPTAKRMGRLTLNPLSHIDPLGLLFLILIKFGWARPVPFNPQNFTHPRLYSVLVGLAGPFSNILLAFFSIVCLHSLPGFFSLKTALLLGEFLKVSVWINVMLGVFNLIPMPPLDGSHLLRALLPRPLLPLYYRFERISFIILIILVSIPHIRLELIRIINAVIHVLEKIA